MIVSVFFVVTAIGAAFQRLFSLPSRSQLGRFAAVQLAETADGQETKESDQSKDQTVQPKDEADQGNPEQPGDSADK